MAGGWSRDGAVQDQIDASVEDAVRAARDRLPKGEGATDCDECGESIPKARREAVVGVSFCVSGQSVIDERESQSSATNRRGSKDSQLR